MEHALSVPHLICLLTMKNGVLFYGFSLFCFLISVCPSILLFPVCLLHANAFVCVWVGVCLGEFAVVNNTGLHYAYQYELL